VNTSYNSFAAARERLKKTPEMMKLKVLLGFKKRE
jgi:hypothetical protein